MIFQIFQICFINKDSNVNDVMISYFLFSVTIQMNFKTGIEIILVLGTSLYLTLSLSLSLSLYALQCVSVEIGLVGIHLVVC